MNRFVLGVAVVGLCFSAYLYFRPSQTSSIEPQTTVGSASHEVAPIQIRPGNAAPVDHAQSLPSQREVSTADDGAADESKLAIPRDLQAALRESFDSYEALLNGPDVMPEWWGNRNVQTDLLIVEPSAYVSRIHCVETLCALDVEHKAMNADEQRAFDVAVLNVPTLQTGALIRRFEGDPRRMRIYVHNVSMQSVPIDNSYQTAADILKREQRMQSASPPDR